MALRPNLRRCAIAFAILSASVLSAQAGGCLKDTRQIKLNKEHVGLFTDYLCRSDRDPQTKVRIQLQRLSGLAAGALLNGGSAPWLEALYGKHRIINNDVLKEYRNLLARFGSAVREIDEGGGDANTIFISSAKAESYAAGETKTAFAKRGEVVRSFRLPDLPDIPLVDETIDILHKESWPSSLKMYYNVHNYYSDPGSLLDQMTVWRYLTPADAKDYSKRLERYNALVLDRKNDLRRPTPKSMQFLEYLTAAGWPETFLYSEVLIPVQAAHQNEMMSPAVTE